MHPAIIISVCSSGLTQAKCCPAWLWWRRGTTTWNLCCSPLQKTLSRKKGLAAPATAWTGGSHWQTWMEIPKMERGNEETSCALCVVFFVSAADGCLSAVGGCGLYSVKYPYLSKKKTANTNNSFLEVHNSFISRMHCKSSIFYFTMKGQ